MSYHTVFYTKPMEKNLHSGKAVEGSAGLR